MTSSDARIIENFFKYFPPTHAIVRANEALAVRKAGIRKPVLDLGCGDGQFVLLTFGKKYINTGVDVSVVEITKAKKSGAYQKLFRVDGKKLPFNSGSFATVLSNSVLEHINCLDETLKESARVLKKGGFMLITVPTPLVSDYLFWSKVIPGWAAFKEKLWRHINYSDEKYWRSKLKKSGLEVVKVVKTNSRQAIKWADILFPLYLFGPAVKLISFLDKRKVFGLSRDGATLIIVAVKR